MSIPSMSHCTPPFCDGKSPGRLGIWYDLPLLGTPNGRSQGIQVSVIYCGNASRAAGTGLARWCKWRQPRRTRALSQQLMVLVLAAIDNPVFEKIAQQETQNNVGNKSIMY